MATLQPTLQLGDRTLTAEDVLPLLTQYNLLPQLLREQIIDQAIASVTCTPEEITAACQQFYQQRQLLTAAEQQAWADRYSLTLEQVEAMATRSLRIEKFKQATWRRKLESYFLKRKGQLDQAVYSLIRVQDAGIAQELYFRLKAGEQSFAELARDYSQGPEAQIGGMVGPVELGSLHPTLARVLQISQPGQLWAPTQLGEWLVIIRLEKLVPVQMTEFIRHRLLKELFEGWLQAQIKQSEVDRLALGVVSDCKPQAA